VFSWGPDPPSPHVKGTLMGVILEHAHLLAVDIVNHIRQGAAVNRHSSTDHKNRHIGDPRQGR